MADEPSPHEKAEKARLDAFLQHACIFSGGPLDFEQKWRRAGRMLALHPELRTAGIHAAVVCGEIEAARRMLADDPALVRAKGGPQGWEPLLFLCYGRLPDARAAEQSLAIAELLLDAGADADGAFIHPDGALRFSALCGAMGRGEMDAPEHPQADALARLLLERGARPNESQGLYNTHLDCVGDDPKWLDLLFRHGLGKDDPINWSDEPEATPPQPIVDYLLAQAAALGHVKRLRCLLEHGANPDAKSRYDGKTCHESALMSGGPEVARLLVEHGATPAKLEGRDAFVAASNRGDREEATRLLEGHPEYLEATDPLIGAARRGRLNVVTLLLDLGMDPNRYGCHGHLALHEASTHQAMCELLLSRGADPRARAYGGTPQGWARRAGNLEMARWHATRSRLVLDAVASGHVDLVKELVAQDPGCVATRSPSGDTVLHALPADPAHARALVDLLLPLGADVTARNDSGKTPAEKLIADGLDEIADLLPSDR